MPTDFAKTLFIEKRAKITLPHKKGNVKQGDLKIPKGIETGWNAGNI